MKYLMILFIIMLSSGVMAMAEKPNVSSNGTVKIFDIKKNAVVEVSRLIKTDEEWKKILKPDVYDVTVKGGTEAPNSCALTDYKGIGIYECVRCGTDLFISKTKFHSGTGWPSFVEPASPMNITMKSDVSFGMVRTEVRCARCGAHLGHVFDDGPAPTYKRYCINGTALRFVPYDKF